MSMNKPIRVLVVDDSALIRKLLPMLLSKYPEFEVVGSAVNGKEALERIAELKPDVVTMDIEMPLMDGLEATRAIMSTHPLPIIIFSTYSKQGAEVTLQALRYGAMDFVTKPSISDHNQEALETVREEMISKLRLASRVRVIRHLPAEAQPEPTPKPFPSPAKELKDETLVVIGVSTGGPSALNRIIPKLPADFQAGTIVVQHMPPTFTKELARQLSNAGPLEVKEAEEGETIRSRVVYVAPGDWHLLVDGGKKLRLSKRPPVNGFRPSIDVTLSSVANIFGSRVIGVVLTGMGRDGTEGMRAVRANGGRAIVQNEETSLIFGMPKSVIEAGLAQEILPLDQIPLRLEELVKQMQAQAQNNHSKTQL